MWSSCAKRAHKLPSDLSAPPLQLLWEPSSSSELAAYVLALRLAGCTLHRFVAFLLVVANPHHLPQVGRHLSDALRFLLEAQLVSEQLARLQGLQVLQASTPPHRHGEEARTLQVGRPRDIPSRLAQPSTEPLHSHLPLVLRSPVGTLLLGMERTPLALHLLGSLQGPLLGVPLTKALLVCLCSPGLPVHHRCYRRGPRHPVRHQRRRRHPARPRRRRLSLLLGKSPRLPGKMQAPGK